MSGLLVGDWPAVLFCIVDRAHNQQPAIDVHVFSIYCYIVINQYARVSPSNVCDSAKM